MILIMRDSVLKQLKFFEKLLLIQLKHFRFFYAYIFRNFLKKHVSRPLDYVLVERLMWVLL